MSEKNEGFLKNFPSVRLKEKCLGGTIGSDRKGSVMINEFHMEKGDFMTSMKKKAVEMIQHIPEENMMYVVNILENLQAMSGYKEKDREMAETALEDILKMEKRLPDNFDMKRELAVMHDLSHF